MYRRRYEILCLYVSLSRRWFDTGVSVVRGGSSLVLLVSKQCSIADIWKRNKKNCKYGSLEHVDDHGIMDADILMDKGWWMLVYWQIKVDWVLIRIRLHKIFFVLGWFPRIGQDARIPPIQSVSIADMYFPSSYRKVKYFFRRYNVYRGSKESLVFKRRTWGRLGKERKTCNLLVKNPNDMNLEN